MMETRSRWRLTEDIDLPQIVAYLMDWTTHLSKHPDYPTIAEETSEKTHRTRSQE